ncbi:hypothetical protein Tco_0067177 [Tanacetum coccineum]
MEAQSFKDLIIQHMDSIEQYIVERALHEQKIQNRLKRLNERKLHIQECKNQEVKAADASFGDKDSSGFYQTKGMQTVQRMIAVRLGMIKAQINKATHLAMKAVGQRMNAEKEAILGMIRISDLPMTHNQWLSNVIPDSSGMCDNDNQANQNAKECDDEHVVLVNLIANLKLDTDENKKIQKQSKKANTSLAQELKECKSILEESNRT